MKNVFLRRILLLIITTVMLFVLLTSTLYVIISRNLYSDMKAQELEPKARTISNFVLMYERGEIPMSYFAQLVSAGPSAWDAWVFVLNAEGNVLVQTNIPDSVDPEGSFLQGIESKLDEVLRGDEISFAGNLANDQFGMMIVGTPVILDGEVIGAVFLAKPLIEITAGINSLNEALLLSGLICMLIMIIPTVYAVNKITKPLKETRDVAIALANGDFKVRAKTISKDEIGDLASSFNLLAEKLEKTISDLVFEKNRLIRILNGLAEGIIAVDKNCNVTHANPALWKLIHEKKMGALYCEITDSDTRAIALRPNNPQFIRNQLISDKSVWEDFRNVIHTGVPVTRDMTHDESIIKIMITPIEDENGSTTGAVGLFQDITEAELLEQTRKDYVANISHELRTPLTGMRGLIEPLADGLVKEPQAQLKYHKIILREVMRLSRLIDDMLELSRLQSKKVTIETKKFDIQSVVEDVVDKLVNTCEEKGINLIAAKEFDNAPSLIGNSDRVEQVLIILIDNAIKFTPSGKNIYIDYRIDKSNPHKKIYISVRDEGVGIESEKVTNVFERFFKGDKSRYGSEGTGLGLSIAKEILNAMGEEISVKSKLNEGSTFTFSLTIDN